MASAFDPAVAFVLAQECGLSEHSADPGGITNFGISQRAYPTLDIRALTEEQARVLYRTDYWDALRCEELPPRLAIAVFDSAVNLGCHRAAILFQKTLDVSADGQIGPATLKAAWHRQETAEIRQIIKEFLARRAIFYASLPTWPHFGFGWMLRLFGLYELTIKMRS